MQILQQTLFFITHGAVYLYVVLLLQFAVLVANARRLPSEGATDDADVVFDSGNVIDRKVNDLRKQETIYGIYERSHASVACIYIVHCTCMLMRV